MEQPPPLSPQELAAMQAAQYGDTGQPQTVKVFGIMHLILAAYGLFGTLIAVIGMFGINPFLAMMPKTPGMAAQAEAQAAMQARMMPATIIGIALTVILAALLLAAGIQLLKKRRGGLKWSNRYAWTSLTAKVVNLILAFTVTIPAMRGMNGGMPGASSVPGGMEAFIIASTLIGVVVTCIYPVLVLILLNRPTTKAWFAERPE